MTPQFPAFKPVGLEDRGLLHELLWEYQPETSELTFTNLFIWRMHYGIKWSIYSNWLLIVFDRAPQGRFALPPVGPPSRQEPTRILLRWLKETGESEPRLERADERLVSEIAAGDEFQIEPVRDDFDYVYRCWDLIGLEGRKYHAKRNFINTFNKNYSYRYEELTENHMAACLEMATRWCELRRCSEDMSLFAEWTAVNEILKNFTALKVSGGAILLDGRVEAFALGEQLNPDTAVVHIEKANPDIRGLYAVINQQFCEHRWQSMSLLNREQDLGEPQLRQAKLSYYPDQLVQKFRVRLRGA
jgi:hypothetical protein